MFVLQPGCPAMERFMDAHREMLDQVPSHLHTQLYGKLTELVFDAGASFSFSIDKNMPRGHQYSLETTRELSREEDIFLADHIWCFREGEARQHLLHPVVGSQLRARLTDLLELDESDDVDDVDHLMRALTPLVSSYTMDGPDGTIMKVYYVLDEVGSRLEAPWSDVKPAIFKSAIILDRRTGASYTAFWPIADVQEGAAVVCEGVGWGKALRLARIQILSCLEGDSAAVALEDTLKTQGMIDLKACLTEHGYAVCQVAAVLHLEEFGNLLPVWDISAHNNRVAFEQRLTQVAEDSRKLAVLVSAFLMGATVRKSDLEAVIEGSTVVALKRLGVLFHGPGDEIRSLVQLAPLPYIPEGADGAVVVATDFSDADSAASGFDPVMNVGVDSLGLVSLAPLQPKVGRALDLCSGCGVQGIMAAMSYADAVTLVELNPRALLFARFNATLNGCQDRVEIVQADLTKASEVSAMLEQHDDYDIVLANPPYIPNPSRASKSLHMYGDGGGTGEEVTRACIIDVARSALRDGGALHLVANIVNVAEFPDRMERWWSSCAAAPRVYQGCIFHGRKWSVCEYAALVHDLKRRRTDDEETLAYAQALEHAGIADICNALLALRYQSTGSSCVRVVAAHDELWQILAMGKPAGLELRSTILAGTTD